MRISVALHTIGQTPRPDLTPFVVATLNSPLVSITGALDGMDPNSIPTPESGGFPLETRLTDGTRIETDAAFLEPFIQSHIDRMEGSVEVHLVLCAGPFPNLTSEGLLIRPFEHACDVFNGIGHTNLLVVVPFEAQSKPSHIKWNEAGFSVEMHAMDERPPEEQAEVWLVNLGRQSDCDALVLDYVGYPKAIVSKVSEMLDIPVYDLGYLAAEFAREVMNEAGEIDNG